MLAGVPVTRGHVPRASPAASVAYSSLLLLGDANEKKKKKKKKNTLDSTAGSYLEGASTANQRIEYWWNFLRSQCVEFWLSLFADLRDNGFFDGGFRDKAILQFCCMGLIQ
ncbi:unnamed protein product, partial [Pleuronectes platessa]